MDKKIREGREREEIRKSLVNYHMTECTHVVMTKTITMQLIYKVLMGSHHLPYPLSGSLTTSLLEPYPKSKSPTRQGLAARHNASTQ